MQWFGNLHIMPDHCIQKTILSCKLHKKRIKADSWYSIMMA